MVDDDSIALDSAVNGEITPVSCIGDFSILEDFPCDLDGVNSTTTISKQKHACFGRTVEVSVWV